MITDITLAEVLRLRHHHRLRDALPQRGLHHQGGDQVPADLHIHTRKTLLRLPLHDEKSGNPLLM